MLPRLFDILLCPFWLSGIRQSFYYIHVKYKYPETQLDFDIAYALQTNDTDLVAIFLQEGAIDFNCHYGSFGTALDYALLHQNYEMIIMIYLAIKAEDDRGVITHNPNQAQNYLVGLIKSYDHQKNYYERCKIEAIVSVIVELEIVDVGALVQGPLVFSKQTIVDLALRLWDSDVVARILTVFNPEDIKADNLRKLVSFDQMINSLGSKCNNKKIKKLIDSGIQFDVVAEILHDDYNIVLSEQEEQEIVGDMNN